MSYADANTKKIGILLWNDQPRYLQNTQGVKDYLKQHGYGEPNVKFTIDNAGGNKLKALESSRKYINAKMDMVITVGTSATVIASNEIKNIPLVFVMVWDPVESKIANDWKSSGNNTTGASSKTSTTKLLSALQEFGNVKRVAVLYTPGERNSEIQLQEFEAEKDSFNVTIIPVPLSNNNMVAPILSDVVKRVDAICLAGSSVVGDSLTTIVDIATKANVVTASQSEDLVERGALMGITVDPYAVGKLAGEKALKILKGAKPSAIPIEPLSKLDLIINMKTAKAGKFIITPDFLKKVSRKIE
ncbi:MAG: ABC transporter substrate-binding protein [Nitrospira sp.]|nr:ABC transporter substrate-binding protein [Nitrospira sp.]